jgi:hypothetical protein
MGAHRLGDWVWVENVPASLLVFCTVSLRPIRASQLLNFSVPGEYPEKSRH